MGGLGGALTPTSPGGYLDPSEDDEVGMVRHLRDLLNTAGKPQNEQPQWEVRDLLSIWWRPNFDGFFVGPGPLSLLTHQYPYKPAHITIPKERKKIFLVTVPPKSGCGLPGGVLTHQSASVCRST